jgi:hypothetical protein
MSKAKQIVDSPGQDSAVEAAIRDVESRVRVAEPVENAEYKRLISHAIIRSLTSAELQDLRKLLVAKYVRIADAHVERYQEQTGRVTAEVFKSTISVRVIQQFVRDAEQLVQVLKAPNDEIVVFWPIVVPQLKESRSQYEQIDPHLTNVVPPWAYNGPMPVWAAFLADAWNSINSHLEEKHADIKRRPTRRRGRRKDPERERAVNAISELFLRHGIETPSKGMLDHMDEVRVPSGHDTLSWLDLHSSHSGVFNAIMNDARNRARGRV